MNLKRFWQFYKPLVEALHWEDFHKAVAILDDMATQEGPCKRWKQLVVRFVGEGGVLPEHLDAMMLLGENDTFLKDYVRIKQLK